MRVTTPQLSTEWAAYYQLRYLVLRQPWQQPPGSERAPDDDAPGTVHAVALADDGSVIGVGRLHAATATQAQVRFMAVHPAWQGKGVGGVVLTYLEKEARQRGLTECVLQARAAAVPFYERAGYVVVVPSHMLFGSVPHFLMRKEL
ncbi:GNAT family N-acetyltransferase [Hymenobacter sp. J193]|uniref:GNAT family N-acetyltransferase n=1 Tax=Hymenobacter sp. J193 TaxID=2898429 RepID=UPI002151F1E8|nr:GNAT family N-acetyltransferase [Hymenobacter sp. J193]MCR5888309.1 GNAT family N-acetyltransferase [Hymenobacter sp. J193]